MLCIFTAALNTVCVTRLEGGTGGATCPFLAGAGGAGMDYAPPVGVWPPTGGPGIETFDAAGTVTLAGGM